MNDPNAPTRGWLGSRSSWVLLCFLAIIGFLLFTEHRAHVLGILPFGFLLLCPLLHLFHHGGHGGHAGHGDQQSPGTAGHQHTPGEDGP